MNNKKNYHKSLLALTNVVAWADGVNHPSEVDTVVTMILHEGIENDTISEFKTQFEAADSLEDTYTDAIETLKAEDEQLQSNAVAWMWQVANVTTNKEDEEIDLGYIEDHWVNKTKYVDLEELVWINRARKELGLSLEAIKEKFKNLPETKRIYDSPV